MGREIESRQREGSLEKEIPSKRNRVFVAPFVVFEHSQESWENVLLNLRHLLNHYSVKGRKVEMLTPERILDVCKFYACSVDTDTIETKLSLKRKHVLQARTFGLWALRKCLEDNGKFLEFQNSLQDFLKLQQSSIEPQHFWQNENRVVLGEDSAKTIDGLLSINKFTENYQPLAEQPHIAELFLLLSQGYDIKDIIELFHITNNPRLFDLRYFFRLLFQGRVEKTNDRYLYSFSQDMVLSKFLQKDEGSSEKKDNLDYFLTIICKNLFSKNPLEISMQSIQKNRQKMDNRAGELNALRSFFRIVMMLSLDPTPFDDSVGKYPQYFPELPSVSEYQSKPPVFDDLLVKFFSLHFREFNTLPPGFRAFLFQNWETFYAKYYESWQQKYEHLGWDPKGPLSVARKVILNASLSKSNDVNWPKLLHVRRNDVEKIIQDFQQFLNEGKTED